MARNSEISLLEKYRLHIDQLDYKFIEDCKDVKVLEKILIVLRSGQEGLYPDLVKFCENRLRELAPKSRLIQSVTRIKRFSDLPESEKIEFENEIESWVNDVKDIEKNTDYSAQQNKDLPPIRGKSVKMEAPQKKEKIAQCEKMEKKCIRPRSYSEWDKFDVEEELKKLDDNADDNHSLKPIEENKKKVDNDPELQTLVSVSDLSEKERQYIANAEKNKGNEAFKARDYKEAISYYTRSLQAYKSTIALNNRAQAYINLKNYFAAVQDCNQILLMDPNDIKALYRRGLALKENKMYDLAEIDFRTLLEIDAENKSAKEQLKQIKRMKVSKPEKKKVVIEEIETSEFEKDEDRNQKGTRMQIEEVTTTENTKKLSNINCNSSDEEDNTTHLPAKVKQMLQIKKTPRKTATQMQNVIDEKGVDKSCIRESKRSEQKIKLIEECKESSPNSNNSDKNIIIQDRNVHDKQKSDTKFVHIDVKNESVGKLQQKQINENKANYVNVDDSQNEGAVTISKSNIKKICNSGLDAVHEMQHHDIFEVKESDSASNSITNNAKNSPINVTSANQNVDNKSSDENSGLQTEENNIDEDSNIHRDVIISNELNNECIYNKSGLLTHEDFGSQKMKNLELFKRTTKNDGCVSPRVCEVIHTKKDNEDSENQFVDVENEDLSQESTDDYRSDSTDSSCKTTNEDYEPVEKFPISVNKLELFQGKAKKSGFHSKHTIRKGAHCNEMLNESETEISVGDSEIPHMLKNDVHYKKVSPYEFLHTWGLDDNKDAETGALNLLTFKPEELPQIISNKLDTPMLTGILNAISALFKLGKHAEGESYLYYLTKVPRINIISMFLTKEEAKSIRDLFSTVECEHRFYMKYVNMILET